MFEYIVAIVCVRVCVSDRRRELVGKHFMIILSGTLFFSFIYRLNLFLENVMPSYLYVHIYVHWIFPEFQYGILAVVEFGLVCWSMKICFFFSFFWILALWTICYIKKIGWIKFCFIQQKALIHKLFKYRSYIIIIIQNQYM